VAIAGFGCALLGGGVAQAGRRDDMGMGTEPEPAGEVAQKTAPTPSVSEPPPAPPPPPPLGEETAATRIADAAPSEWSRWYGGQTFAVDGLAVATAATALSMRSSGGRDMLLALSVGTYAFGPPLVHMLHGEGLRGLGSMALRVGVPLLVYELAMSGPCSTEDKYRDEPCMGRDFGAVFWTLLSYVAVTVVDGAALAYEEAPPRSGPSIGVAPWVASGTGGLSVAGTF
jgi:hypothetical protein